MKAIICAILFIVVFPLMGQKKGFEVSISADTLYMGNVLGLKYQMINIQGDFQPPVFEDFDLVSGPNVSSSFSMINGEVEQSASYEYFLRPVQIGTFLIPSAVVQQREQEIYSSELFITVVDNPEGIEQNPRDYHLQFENMKGSEIQPLSKEDSLKIKLRKVKAKKI